jgi:hypothetical protein
MEFPHTCTIQVQAAPVDIAYTLGSWTQTANLTAADTATGGTSHATATDLVIATASGAWADDDAAGTIAAAASSGTFQAGETVTIAISAGAVSYPIATARASGAQTAAAADAYGEAAPGWANEQTLVPCRFYYSSPGEQYSRDVSGTVTRDALSLLLPTTATISNTRRIVTTQDGYAGTYDVDAIRARAGVYGAVDHYEVSLREVSS